MSDFSPDPRGLGSGLELALALALGLALALALGLALALAWEQESALDSVWGLASASESASAVGNRPDPAGQLLRPGCF